MAQASTRPGGHVEGFAATQRTDNWWVGPVFTAVVFTLWLAYFFTVAASGRYYAAGPYISPFFIGYSHPPIPNDPSPQYALFGLWPAWWPTWLSPALIVGGLPGVFRITCYYYRKAYYRAYFGLPPACAVGPRKVADYRGETGIALFQNLHRYTLYIAILLLPLLYLDAIWAFSWRGQPGIGLGSVLLVVNAVLLTGYTLGCHAWRHLVGGRLNCFSCDGASELRYDGWRWVTWLNQRHLQWAWASLLWIAFADLYIRSVSMGILPDINTWSGVTWISEFH